MTGSPTILEVKMTEFPSRLHVGYERKMIRDDSQEFWLDQLSNGVVLYWHGEDNESRFGEGNIRHSALAL